MWGNLETQKDNFGIVEDTYRALEAQSGTLEDNSWALEARPGNMEDNSGVFDAQS
jgi:hypothetical protein